MVHNYYIIRKIAEELKARCTGLSFIRAYSVHAHELRIELGNESSSEVIIARLAPGTPSIYLTRDDPEPPKRNVVHFFQALEGISLTEVAIAPYDRIIYLQFEDHTLFLRFYDRPNALLFEGDKLLSTFKKASSEAAPVALDNKTGNPSSLLSKPLRRELAHRGSTIEEFERELLRSDKTYVYKHIPEHFISPINFTGIDAHPEIFKSASLAVEETVVHRYRVQALEGSRRSLLETLDSILDKTAAARIEASGSLSDSSRIDRYMHIGQEILTRSGDLKRGTSSLAIEYQGSSLTVELDPALTPYENANRFFEKARTGRTRKADVVKRIASLERDEEKLLGFRERIIEASNLKELDLIRKDLTSAHYTLHQQAADAVGATGPRFREFEVAGGMRVLVGKNAKQNDELTLHVAQKEDLWFHARHVSGSHVVLRSGKNPNIPQRAIEQAAELAAYFSDARSQTHAPVAYTRRKYVRKPRGAAPGAVKLEREEVIIVTPQISAHPIAP